MPRTTPRPVRTPLATGALMLAVVAGSAAVPASSQADERPGRDRGPGHGAPHRLPATIDGGAWPTSHVQGVAVDQRRGHVYWSFTQVLVKTDLRGRVLGTVEGLTGHLGDLDIGPRDGRVYGSLEYKDEEAFYIAIFDGDAIDRVGMDAEDDGVMTTVHLQEVVDDFTADLDGDGRFDGDTADTADHRYGSSGIDGVAFGPAFGAGRQKSRTAKQYLVVAYGIYRNDARIDNDHQVLLQYDVERWERYERPLSQQAPHRSGPAEPRGKYFVLTGNTRYGVQNLEHDEHTGNWMMAVYPGSKPAYPNEPFFVVDGSVAPRTGIVRGQAEPERGQLLELLPQGRYHAPSGTFGWEAKGDVGMVSLGGGSWYLVQDGEVERDGRTLETAEARLHRWTGATPAPFTRVTG